MNPSWTNGVRAPAIYARVSSDEQVDGTSLEDQVEKCRKQSAVYGWTVPDEMVYIDDGFSGGTLQRPQMSRLRSDVRHGLVDCILVYKLDRLSRNIKDTVNLVLGEWTNETRVVFRSVSEDFNTNSPLGVLVFSILASFANFELHTIRQRTQDGRLKRFHQGRRAAGDAPYGYTRSAEHGYMTVDPEQADVVRQMFRLYLQGFGTMKIATTFNASGVMTSRGNFWTETAVRRILMNEVYTGRVKYGGESNEGLHQPIVDRETFEAVQSIRLSRHKVGGRAIGTPFLLAGLVTCKECGHHLYTQPGTRSRRTRKDGSVYYTKNRPYYMCGGRLKKGSAACRCGHVFQDDLEQAVVERLRLRFAPEVASELCMASIRSELEVRLNELVLGERQVDLAVEARRASVKRWEKAFEEGDLEASRFAGRLQALEHEIDDLLAKKEAVSVRKRTVRAQLQDMSWVAGVSSQVDEWASLPVEAKKHLLLLLIDRVEVWKESQGKGRHRTDTLLAIDIYFNNDRPVLAHVGSRECASGGDVRVGLVATSDDM